MFARAVVPHVRAPMSRSDGSKPPAVEQDAFALQSVAEAAIAWREWAGVNGLEKSSQVDLNGLW